MGRNNFWKTLVAAFGALAVLGACQEKKPAPGPSGATAIPEDKKEVLAYTCSMHPWVKSDKPGTCPACGMALVPIFADAEAGESGSGEHRHGAEPPPAPAAGHEGHAPAKAEEKKILYYVDPMHPWYKSDKPGKAPDCGMDLVPVYAEGEGAETQPTAAMDRVKVKVSGEKQQLIGVTTAAVEARPLERDIYATGRVAYDPDLLVAQSEYLTALKTGGGALGGLQGGLVQAAKTRLQLLGMNEPQISELRRKGKPNLNLLVPQKGESVWIYASLYESDLPWVEPGAPAQVILGSTGQVFDTHLASIDPVIDPVSRTAQARLQLSNPEGKFKPEMYVRVRVKAQGGRVLAIPESALIETGTRHIAYVDAGAGAFQPREVKIGRRGTGYVEVLGGLAEGDRVVTNGNFLIDSESRLKATLSGGTGGHQH